MPYSIHRYNGSTISVVQDGTIDNTTDLRLVGKNYAGYGEIQNDNYVWLLENFSGTVAPPNAISGQVWYDSGSNKLKFYDKNNSWRTTGGAALSESQPTGLTQGDLWFQTSTSQLYACSTSDGTQFQLIGPQGVTGFGATQMQSISVQDNNPSPLSHAIIQAKVGESGSSTKVVFAVSPTAFTLGTGNPITGFSVVEPGITLNSLTNTTVNSTPVYSTRLSSYRFWGTATDSDALGGYPASAYATTQSLGSFLDAGFTVGTSPTLRVWINSGTPYIQNTVGNTIVFQTSSGGTQTPIKLQGGDILPGSDATSQNPSNIGSGTARYNNVYAVSFKGIADKAQQVQIDSGSYAGATVSATANTIAARGNDGSITASTFTGIATSAKYADLAEKYLADQDYPVGTVVMVGGDAEVTESAVGYLAIGIVSAKPAFMMNKDLEGGTYIALKGRVPVRVRYPVCKGDRLISFNRGTAISCENSISGVIDLDNEDISYDIWVFAIALEDNDGVEERLVEAVIL